MSGPAVSVISTGRAIRGRAERRPSRWCDRTSCRPAAAQRHFIDAVGGLRGLSHPNIASLYDVGEEAGTVFLAIEWVKGVPLRSLVAGQPLKVRRAISF